MASNAAALLDIAVDTAIETAIASLLSSYSSIKTSDQSPVLDRVGALRILTRRIVKKNTTNGHRKREANVGGTSQ